MKTFKHSGKCGDIIFSLPAIRELGGGILYLPKDGCESKGLYDNMKSLLEMQPYIIEVREYPSGLAYREKAPGIQIDYDLDEARNQPGRGVIHIVKRYLDAFNINLDNWKDPWLNVDRTFEGVTPYTLINYTGRHIVNNQTGHKSKVNWKVVYESIVGSKMFVGTIDEYKSFCETVGQVGYSLGLNALTLAMMVKGADRIYCNQSLVLALSQALGREYYLDVKPGKTNCLLYTKNEHLL